MLLDTTSRRFKRCNRALSLKVLRDAKIPLQSTQSTETHKKTKYQTIEHTQLGEHLTHFLIQQPIRSTL